jgi:hypothetical protein
MKATPWKMEGNKLKHNRQNHKTAFHAQAIVELAITLPVLLILILGMVNLGVLINAQIVLTQAAWEGARAGVTADPVEDPGDPPIIGAVKSSLSGIVNPDSVIIEIEPSVAQRDRGESLTVSLAYPLRLTLPFPVNVTLTAQATSRIEYTKP